MKENSTRKDNINAGLKILDDFANLYGNTVGMTENDYKKIRFAIDNILPDYKRVLKENEELRQEKIDNQKINLLAQNSMLDYQNGYEDGKANRRSAVQAIMDNQQYYIFQKQIEKYERHIEKLQKENKELRDKYATFVKMSSEVIANNIPVQKVKDKIEEYKKMLLSCNRFSDVDRIKAINERILELQELIESEKK